MKWEEVDKHKEHITRYCKKVKSFTSYENEDLNEFVVQIYTDLCGCDCENDDEFKKSLANFYCFILYKEYKKRGGI